MEKDTAIGSQILKEVREWLQAIVVALIVAMLTHIFIVQPTRVIRRIHGGYLHNGDSY